MWLFFDVGCTLVSEEDYLAFRDKRVFQELHSQTPDLLWEDYQKARKEIIPTRAVPLRDRKIVEAIVTSLAGREAAARTMETYLNAIYPQFQRLLKPYPDAVPALEHLSPDYSLGIIANQRTWMRPLLEKWELAGFFKVIILSEEVGLEKPNPEIFRLALDKANTRPQDTIMIGDRPEADIGPAKTLGMRTIRVRRSGDTGFIEPLSIEEKADFEVTSLLQIPDVLTSSHTPWMRRDV